MSQAILQEVEQAQMKSDLPTLHIGDTVDVHVLIIEGSKQRVQVFNGVVIKMQSKGLTRTFTVRRIVANEGVERTFPLHSPKIAKIEIKRHGHTRRARLYYLRKRVGKARRLRDRRRGLGSLLAKPEPKAQEATGTSPGVPEQPPDESASSD